MKNYKIYPEIITINKAIHPVKREVNIYRINPLSITKYPNWVKGIASLDPFHHKKTDISTEDIIQESVVAESLMNVIVENNFICIVDYFQIDTEGFDFEILKMIDFKKIKPKIIKFESVNLNDSDRMNANMLLKMNGYYLFNEQGDTIGLNLNSLRLFL